MSSDPYEGPLCFAILFLVIHAWCISGETALRALSERSGGGDEEKQDRISRLSYALLENSQRSIMSLQIFRLLCCLLCGSFGFCRYFCSSALPCFCSAFSEHIFQAELPPKRRTAHSVAPALCYGCLHRL